MNAMEMAKGLGREEVLRKLEDLKVEEYGLRAGLVTDHFRQAIEESQEYNETLSVMAGLDNSDVSGILLQAVTSVEKLCLGMQIAAYALDTEEMVLHLPLYRTDLLDTWKAAAKPCGIRVETGIIKPRTSHGASVHHILTMLRLVDALEGSLNQEYYVSVNDASLQMVGKDVKISSLLDAEGLKAVEAGYRLYKTDDLDRTIGEAGVVNGVLRGITPKNCLVCESQKRLHDYRTNSCGTCVFCREGLIQLEHMQQETSAGKGKAEFPALTREIGEAMLFSNACSLGEKSPEFVLSAQELFPEEFEQHIKKKSCSADVCFSAKTIYIDPQACTGCEECLDVCPVNCIEGKSGFIHMIDEFECTKCGACITACPEQAICETSGKLPKLPNRLTKVGKFKKH